MIVNINGHSQPKNGQTICVLWTILPLFVGISCNRPTQCFVVEGKYKKKFKKEKAFPQHDAATYMFYKEMCVSSENYYYPPTSQSFVSKPEMFFWFFCCHSDQIVPTFTWLLSSLHCLGINCKQHFIWLSGKEWFWLATLPLKQDFNVSGKSCHVNRFSSLGVGPLLQMGFHPILFYDLISL